MPPSLARPKPVRELIAESPLVPVALAATTGLIADRYLKFPLAVDVLVLIAGLVGWLVLRRRPKRGLIAAWFVVGALAALYHHAWRNVYHSDDIGHFATEELKLVRLRGVLEDEPAALKQPPPDGLASHLRPDPTRCNLGVREALTDAGWAPVSGNVRLTVDGALTGLHVGDDVEVFGWLARPRGPGNPGEWDWPEYLRDQRVRAELRVRKGPGTVTRLAEGWSGTAAGWLAHLRGWGQRTCERELPPKQAGVTSALLLGEGASMTSADWDKYIRTGVIHVLAISGQHLVILAGFLAVVLRVAGVSRRKSALVIAAILVGYAMLTGFRPPVQRAAVAAAVACVAVMMRRLPLPANTFALAWLVVIALNPTDPFGMGCQLSFLQVAVLIWGIARWMDGGDPDPLDRLIEESRPRWVRLLRAVGKFVLRMYAITFVLGLSSLPLIASWQHLVSLSGFLIGPLLIVLTSIALIAGFLMLLAAPLGLAAPFAGVTRWSMAASEGIVDLAERLPGGHIYVADVPIWWLWAFYLGLLALLWYRPSWPRRRMFAVGGVAWVAFGLIASTTRTTPDELRVTFLAVGHGGCTVLELPDGRVLLYDAGAMGGPEVTRRHIAPFLWHRGRRRVDELFLSHADLDHFNGVVDLLERFDVGLVTCTPSFADKDLPGVQRTLAAIRARGVPIRIVHAGNRLEAGDVIIDVLHPPQRGPDGNENVRSMVLRVVHRGHAILLTGDLESPGLDQVTHGPGGGADVMMSPHHGSVAANTRSLAQWALPRLVVVPDSKAPKARKDDPYAALRAEVWVTDLDGAVTVRSRSRGLVAESFRTRRRLELSTETE